MTLPFQIRPWDRAEKEALVPGEVPELGRVGRFPSESSPPNRRLGTGPKGPGQTGAPRRPGQGVGWDRGRRTGVTESVGYPVCRS